MADVHEKDYGHTGSFNPNYPTASNPKNPATNEHSHMDGTHDPDQALRKIRTAGSISISPELFEKIYLSPQNNVKGDLRGTFANPTPLALLGFLLSLSPLSCDLMGWRGAGGSGIASIGAYYFMGGLLMIIGGVLDWVLGNTFPFVVFCSLGGFWLTFATTLNAAYGAQGGPFPESFAFFLLFMGLLCFVYLIASLRTNVIFFTIFLTLTIAFCTLAGAYWHLAKGTPSATAYAGKLEIVAGAFFFVTCMAGWWIFLAQMLASVDFPIQIPVFDISHIIKPASAKLKEKDDRYNA
ncbi:GPR1/FUN34/yaaH [Lasallia pustulata]|uniref:GPR1/FUN34/yaaH n=1 Tax=Lasallia pustulata TaxID=136370 RepID=A0A1W5DCD9_9LECA|nr:GPR1/FUN34/yaaH [Lasallia pustulata]